MVLTGGSLLATAGLRLTTDDADSVRQMTEALHAAAEVVAAEHDLKPTWLNDRAAPFAPVTLQETDCSLLLDHPRLLVLGAPLRQVFLMKMFARRPVDLDDLAELWEPCRFSSVQAAVAEFYLAYPHEEDDPYLARWLAVSSAKLPRGSIPRPVSGHRRAVSA